MNSNREGAMAIPFITFSEGSGFTLAPEAEAFLMALPEERQLGIVSIVGKYRTGKSFFVNRVLLNQKKGGFQVGPTINPCTKGLWLWKQTVKSASNPDMDIILIDTEGFGGMDENANHDSRIFLFSLLLSSYFIYNSVGSIDENALNTLNLIINLAKDIQTKTNKYDDAANFPSLLWVVRDFTLQMVDKHQNKINSKEYLENSLELQKGTSDAVENKNKIRRLMKHFFQDRDCEVMFRPSENEKDLQRLDEMDNSNLRPEFNAQVELIRNKVYRRVKVKKVGENGLNGRLLVGLCKGYMDSINKGLVPNVESAWFYVCRNEGIRAVQQAGAYLDAELEKHAGQGQAVTQPELDQLKARLKEDVLRMFKKRSLGSEEGHGDLLQKLERRFEQSFGELARRNKIIWEEKYELEAERAIQQIKDKIYGEEYGDFGEFVDEYERMKKSYDEQTEGGDAVQKWKYFNDSSEYLYKLAGETISNKVSKALKQNQVQMQMEMGHKLSEVHRERDMYKAQLDELQQANAKTTAVGEKNMTLMAQYKAKHEEIYEKYKALHQEHETVLAEAERAKRKRGGESDLHLAEVRTELEAVKSTLDKERTLFQMETKYSQEEMQRHRERAERLEVENRRLKLSNAGLMSDLEQAEKKLSETVEQAQMLRQSNTVQAKRMESLLAENAKKSEQVSEQGEWMLQKTYLENNVSFLRNTLNENKRLHDALLVAFQQSLSQGEQGGEMVEANRHLSQALEKVEGRYKLLEERYEKVKDFKRIMAGCLGVQCAGCRKIVVGVDQFKVHVEQCGQNKSEEQSQKADNSSDVHITVSQTIVRESDKKPFTEYTVQVINGDSKWKVTKRYREFSELQQLLIQEFPSIKYPPSCNFLADINNLVAGKQRNVMAEERRKSLQQYLRDLLKIDQIKDSHIYRGFLDVPAGVSFIESRKSKKN